MDRPAVPGQPYGRMHGYDPYIHAPGYSRFTERAVFDYSDRGEGARFGDRPLYGSAKETGFSPQVVDYNHGSLSASSSTDKDRELPIAPKKDIDPHERATGMESRQSVYRSPQDEARPATRFDADVDIKFIQDTIVSCLILVLFLLWTLSSLLSCLWFLC